MKTFRGLIMENFNISEVKPGDLFLIKSGKYKTLSRGLVEAGDKLMVTWVDEKNDHVSSLNLIKFEPGNVVIAKYAQEYTVTFFKDHFEELLNKGAIVKA